MPTIDQERDVAVEAERHNRIMELLEKISNGEAAEAVIVNFTDHRPSRTSRILDLGIDHIYLSEGSSNVGKKIELNKISEIEWTEQTSQTLELE